jgi:hypothetical protein
MRDMGLFLGFVGATPTRYLERWRMGWDSNPRYPCGHAGFQDRCLKPLGHPSDFAGERSISSALDAEHIAVVAEIATEGLTGSTGGLVVSANSVRPR